MAQILEPLRVPVVHCDLTLTQNVQDIFHALERLSSTVDDVFGHIGNKIQTEKSRINEVNALPICSYGLTRRLRSLVG